MQRRDHVKVILGLLAVLCFISTAPALAQQTSADHEAHRADAKAGAEAPMSDGEVRKVDKSGGKLTIKHGPLQNLDMPPMTMNFRVKDPVMLDQVKEGDRIKFTAEKLDGALVVTNMQQAK
jgi:Cu(I)/Ag(I) efflux system periplasmic protein CusF